MSASPGSSFFRQGGWMFLATLLGGIFMFAVHPVYGSIIGEKKYGDFAALVALINMMGIPTLGLSITFAHQAASTVTEEDRARLARISRTLLQFMLIVWVVMLLGAVLFQRQLIKELSIQEPMSLWLTVGIGLAQLWLPILSGLLQGLQNFLWLGWVSILNGLGRFAMIGLMIWLIKPSVTAAVAGALIGMYAAVVIAGINTREVWQRKVGGNYDWRPWLQQVVPLTLGLGASQFLLNWDIMVLRSLFGDNQTGYYGMAGTIGRGVVLFTAPLTAVMFPKIVHGLTHGRKSNVLTMAVVGTCGLGCIAALVMTGISAFIASIANGYTPSFLPDALAAKLQAPSKKPGVLIFATLLPWFVWSMLPLSMANVLLNNLLARKRYRIVVYAVALAVAYALVLRGFGYSFTRIVQIVGLFNVGFFVLAAIFTWREGREQASSVSPS